MGKQHDLPEMNRLEELRLQRELKEIILGNSRPLTHFHTQTNCASPEYISTIYTPAHPSNRGFAILVCRHTHDAPPAKPRGRDQSRSGRDEFVVVRVITYLTPDKTRWEVVTESSKAQFGILPALQEFTKDLEREMGKMIEQHGKGKKRSGLFAEDDGEEEYMERKHVR
jgi:hypothetical protein